MDYVVLVTVVQGISDLICVLGGPVLVESPVVGCLQVTIQLPLAGQL